MTIELLKKQEYTCIYGPDIAPAGEIPELQSLDKMEQDYE